MKTIPLMQGAAMARKSYGQLLRLVLLGTVRGEQLEGRRWVVSVDDVRQLANGAEPATRRASAAGVGG